MRPPANARNAPCILIVKRQWAKSLVHHTIVDALVRFLKDCEKVEVKKEYKYWDPARVGKDGSRRVPDVTCVNPNTGTEYVLDAQFRLSHQLF